MNKELLYSKETVYKKADSAVIKAAFEYADGYKAPIKEFTVSNETNTKRIQALIVEHPSGSNGKSRAKWHTILKAFLKLDD